MTEMTTPAINRETGIATYAELDARVREARSLRARTIREGAVRFWAFLRRAAGCKPARLTIQEA